MTLQAKIYNHLQLYQVERNLKFMLEGLNVRVLIREADPRGWVGISVSGEDERVAMQYLAGNIGFCSPNLADVSRFSDFKGFVVDPTGSRNELLVDIGISSPTRVDASIPLYRLQAQLGDGRKIALNKLIELFGLCQNLPLHIRVSQIDFEKKRVEAELSEKQQKQYGNWMRSLLDRLLILGASYSEVKAAVKIAQISRDIINIEPLGVFEHAMVCKLGTDAAGLIPKIGRTLPRTAFSVFNPRKVLGLLGEGSVLYAF